MNRTLLFCTAILFLCFITLSQFVRTELILPIDEAIATSIYSLEAPALTEVMKAFSFVGSVVPVVIISFIFLFIFYMRYRSLSGIFVFLFASIASVSLNVILKNYFQRERPSLINLITETGFSFPSGHSMASLSLYGAITYIFWTHLKNEKNRLILLIGTSVMILCIGFSRIYLGVHYPSDVVGGYLLSGALLSLIVSGHRYYERKSLVRLGN